MKQKILKQPILYISKQLKSIDVKTNEERFFPFLNSKLFDLESKKKMSFAKIAGICNSSNILDFLNKRPPCYSFLFFGRSNVGKSSLINKLIGVPVNETSKKPDAPGYGYASAASKDEIRKWGKLIELYLKNTPKGQSEQICVLLDINHGIKQIDIMLLDMLQAYKRDFIIVFTKSDKATEKILEDSEKLAYQLQEKYDKMNFYVHYTSSETLLGVEQLRNHILFKIVSQAGDQQMGKK